MHNDLTATDSSFRTHVDHPVRCLDDIKIVLNQDDRVPNIHQTLNHFQQFVQIFKVQTGRGLVQQVQRTPGVRPRKFRGQLDPLGLTSRKRRSTLSKRQIVQSNVAQRLQDPAYFGDVGEVLDRFPATHLQHIVDRFAVVTHGQRFFVVAATATRFALDPHVGQEVHLDTFLSVPKTLFAPTARHVEAKPTRRIATNFGVGQLRKQVTNQIKGTSVSRRV